MLTETRRLPTIAKGALALLVAISLLGVLFLLVLRPAGQQLGCQQTLRYTWYPLFADYSGKDPDGKYPPLSGVPGVFAPEYNAVKPFITEEYRGQLFCPTAFNTHRQLSAEAQLLHPTYAYYGYAFQNEDELLAFLEAYPRFIEGGANFNDDLPAPEGQGSFGGDQFLRLREILRPDGAVPTPSIPILIEIPSYTQNGLDFRHPKPGGYVSLLGGGATFVEFGDQFPMTPAVIEKIGEIKARYE